MSDADRKASPVEDADATQERTARIANASAGDEMGDDIRPTDIVFDCGHCGKSLVIDYRGAGLVTQCTECGASVTVPIPDGMELGDLDQTPEEQEIQIIHLRRALNQAESRIQELETTVTGLKERRSVLERSRAEGLHRFSEIRAACEHVQRSQVELSSAIGRIMDVISRD